MRSDLPHVHLEYPANHPPLPPKRRAKSGVPRRAQRRKAAPLPGYRSSGAGTPVRLCITPRIGAELWLEVEYLEGRFWIHHDASVWDLVKRMQEGGMWVAEHAGKSKHTR